jgi:hypothetical protein
MLKSPATISGPGAPLSIAVIAFHSAFQSSPVSPGLGEDGCTS